MAARKDRKAAIRELVRTGTIRKQAELVELLKGRGFDVTQATVSRDMADLKLEKAGGYYVLPEDMKIRSLAQASVRDTRRTGNQVVILTGPGAAQSIAFAIDDAMPDGVLGTLAGDDTVLVITKDEEAGKRFQAAFEQLIG